MSHATSFTFLRPHQAKIKGDYEEYAVDLISDVKIDDWPRRGPYLQLFTHFVSFDIPEWIMLEQVDDCEQLSIFLSSEKVNVLSLGRDYLELFAKYPMRNIVVR